MQYPRGAWRACVCYFIIFSPVHVRLYLERAPARGTGPGHCAPPGALSTPDEPLHADRGPRGSRVSPRREEGGSSPNRRRDPAAATYWQAPRNRDVLALTLVPFLISVQVYHRMYLSCFDFCRFDNPHDALPVPLNDGDARARCTRRHDYTHGRKSAFPSDHADLNLLRSAV